LTIVPVTQITRQQLERARIEVEQKHELIKTVGEEHCADWIGKSIFDFILKKLGNILYSKKKFVCVVLVRSYFQFLIIPRH